MTGYIFFKGRSERYIIIDIIINSQILGLFDCVVGLSKLSQVSRTRSGGW